MKKILIKTENLCKTYADNGVPVEALKEIHLEINKGEFTALVGPSGSGKTTLLNLISGLDSPTKGEILLEEDKIISSMTSKELSEFRRNHIGFIFQAFNLIPVLTVEENIEFIMLLQHVPTIERKQRVKDILIKLNLAGFETRFPNKLSGGQQQRVAIARAMVTNPMFILADEPTANLDSKTGTDLLDLMHSLNKSTQMTFLFSTHDPMIMERADRIITLKDGKIHSDERKT